MKTLPLRELLRRPATVKRLTAAGQSVQITDNGKPLWVVQPAADHFASRETDAARHRMWEEYFQDLLQDPLPDPALPSLTEILDRSRGER
jgi:hypothetical protein